MTSNNTASELLKLAQKTLQDGGYYFARRIIIDLAEYLDATMDPRSSNGSRVEMLVRDLKRGINSYETGQCPGCGSFDTRGPKRCCEYMAAKQPKVG